MTEHKFTDDEIIKALECCHENSDCGGCDYGKYRTRSGLCMNMLHANAATCIKVLKGELKKKVNDNDFLQDKVFKEAARCRIETIKEFAERLKAELTTGAGIMRISVIDIIDTLANEMTGDQT